MTDEERYAAADAALTKVREGIAEYAALQRAEGDAETLTGAVVLFEASGIDGEDGTIYTRNTSMIPIKNQTATVTMGILQTAGPRLERAIRFPQEYSL